MNTLEQFSIQLHSSNNQLIAEQCPVDDNPVFEPVYDFHNTPSSDKHQQYHSSPPSLLSICLQRHYTQAASATWYVNTTTILCLIYIVHCYSQLLYFFLSEHSQSCSYKNHILRSNSTYVCLCYSLQAI